MTFTDRHIVDAYSNLFEGLNDDSKLALIERLSKSLRKEKKKKEKRFFESFGAFGSKLSPETIIADIKDARKFKKKEIKF